MQYRTTALFLRTFGLSSLEELPDQGVDALRDKLKSGEEQMTMAELTGAVEE